MKQLSVDVRVRDLEEFKVFAGQVYRFVASEYARHRDDCNAKGLGCDCGFETAIRQLFESRTSLGFASLAHDATDLRERRKLDGARDRLRAWSNTWIAGARLHQTAESVYRNPGELKDDLRIALDALDIFEESERMAS